VKILFINRMMGTAWGGGENFDYHLARGLMRRGHEVVVLTGTAAGTTVAAPAGLECIAIGTPYLRKHMYTLAGKVPVLPGLLAEADLRIFMERAKSTILKTMRERKIDVVQILALPYLASWLTHQTPAAMRFPGPPAWFQSGLLQRLGRNPRFKMFAHGDAVDYFAGQLQTPVREVPPGINRDLFRLPTGAERAAARAGFGFRKDDFVVSTVGRLIAGKGHEFLIRALGQSSDERVKILVVGDGPLRKRFESMAAEVGLGHRVIFAGQQASAGVVRSLWAADTFCLLSAYENYSNAALEAMAAGLPVVASDVGGFPKQIVEGQNGHLIACNDDEKLLTCIQNLQSQPERRRAMAQQAETFAARFSWDAAASQVEEIYAELTA
jgi:glycosyltransferase involved in cell wall biosynthesis